jgi:formylmethanofuran dehydrogenase subunit E-like metal-binding protein
MTLRLLVLLAVLLAAPARAQDVFDSPATAETFAHDLREAAQTLKGAKTLRGDYVQDKSLAGVPHPLHAEGSFVFVRDLGIAWLTSKPFESELVITGDDIIQRENGKVSMHLSASQQPAVHVVSEIFSAVFALDFDSLSANFELYSRKAGRGWELGERVRVQDANGDETDIHLRASVVSQAAPATEELKRFRP